MHGIQDDHMWQSNRGMVLVLTGEVFRAGMTASTKVLQMDGLDGEEGMGTLQVSICYTLSRHDAVANNQS